MVSVSSAVLQGAIELLEVVLEGKTMNWQQWKVGFPYPSQRIAEKKRHGCADSGGSHKPPPEKRTTKSREAEHG